ncbi:carbamoyl-phosphate synthase large subunit [Lactobacillus colini]|uniref:Carbamoyl-phosphate synthase large subunit n=1 Tax=Lactobacillus colini TaxID=1819254 RepID=A0ABS4MEB3_9LACO|nr:carbamoyl phosphate synthase large subunit [Lactobacillus colini]MBP2058028.1 carbamoyl-phosphate synthase large subunit [Lactobacillus colini]
MPLHSEINKVLIVGAGPTIVGEVSEMDILGQQALEAFLEDNLQVVLINPNPATVQTDKRKNLRVFLEPMTLPFVKRVIRMEKPDAIFTACGGKPALSLTSQLLDDGILQDMKINLLSINQLALNLQDHANLYKFFKQHEFPTAKQWLLNNEEDLTEKFKQVHYPLLLTKRLKYRPDTYHSFSSWNELKNFFDQERELDRFDFKNYILNEDFSNWEEIILDAVRDNNGNICFINNTGSLESVKINSADSLLVSPVITRNNNQMRQLRTCVKKIADAINIHGCLSVHFAVKQDGEVFTFNILSVKPRITHTSLIAYRSGVYSVGYITAKIALGYNLNEITDPQSGLNAAIEPVKDAFSVQLPYWSFIESGYNHYELSNKPTSSGSALGIGRNFEAAFMKALQATTNFDNNLRIFKQEYNKSEEEIITDLEHPLENHLIILAAAIAKGIPYTTLHQTVHIHPAFLQKFNHIMILIRKLTDESLDKNLLLKVKANGFSNRLISYLTGKSEDEISNLLNNWDINPSYIRIDGTAGLEEPKISAFYSAYGTENELKPLTNTKKCLILGLKPFQVSLTGEFDYMIYHAAETLRQQGISPIIISNNPESISASYNCCDRVYFEPLTLENILAIAKKEDTEYIMTQFSGKQINEYRLDLLKHGLKIIGQPNIGQLLGHNIANLIIKAGVNPVPALITVNESEIDNFVSDHGFPVLIGGTSNHKKQKSAVVFDVPALKKYISENELDKMTISKFIEGNKYEITAISDGKDVTLPGIIEHFEQTGSHASDSIAVYQPQNLSTTHQRLLRDAAVNIASHMHICGPINLHFLISNDQIYVLQIKTYSGHNVAFLSKSLHQDIASITTQVLLGKSLSELGLNNDVWPSDSLIHVKMPVFSYLRYRGENTFDSLMKTSGSVIGRATKLPIALYKGYEASDLIIPSYGTVFISVKDSDKNTAIEVAARFHKLGFNLLATEGTANILAEKGITTGVVEKIQEGNNSLLEKIAQHRINLVINVTSLSDSASHDAIMIKDQALSTHIPVFSSLQSADDILKVLETMAMTTQPL